MSTEDIRNQAAEEAAEAEVSEEALSEQRKIRREKLKALQDAGRNPFLEEKWNVTAHSMDIKENYEAMEDQEVSIAGRIMAFRNMGKASFINIQDKQGRIQVYVKRDDIGAEEYQWFKKYDMGDILGIEGKVFKTKTGEISVHATRVVLLSKSIQVLPDKW
ncbi:MAG: OB-fold nucleic acid binding domain-containing protein, partial [Anaerovoracaceae bacterium]